MNELRDSIIKTLELRKMSDSLEDVYMTAKPYITDSEIDGILMAFWESLPELPPVSHAGNPQQLHAIMGQKLYRDKVIELIKEAKKK